MAASDLFLFVSHVSEDRTAALQVVGELERRGIPCWIAPRNVRAGKPFDDEIAEAIDSCRGMLLIFSERCNDSDYIRREVTVAGEANKLVIPFRIENAQPKKGLRVRLADLHWIDAFAERERAIDELVRTLRPGENAAAPARPARADEPSGERKDQEVAADRAAFTPDEKLPSPGKSPVPPIRPPVSTGAKTAPIPVAKASVPTLVPPRPVSVSVPVRRIGRFDLTWPVLIGFAALLCVLIILPMSWLVYYSFTDHGSFTLANFARLVTDPIFLDPLKTTLILAASSSVICCLLAAPMGWLVARTDMPLGRTVRSLVTASFVTPPFLGAIAWELLAAPNSGLLNKAYRAITGAPQEESLFNIYTLEGLIFVISCYTFPYVFVLVANSLDRIPGDLEDASSILGGRWWVTARRITIPLALPAVLAGGLVAFLQAMTLFGSPAILAIPAGFHTMTTKIWSLFQYPPKPELAAAASLPLLVVTVFLLRAEAFILGRRGYSVVGGKQGDPRLVKLGKLKWVALGVTFLILLNPVFLPYFALINAAFSRVASQIVSFDNITLHNVYFVFYELSTTQLAIKNTVILGVLSATIGTLLAVVISYLTARKAIAGHRALGFLATAPVAVPGIVLGVGLFLSYTRPPFVLYGTLWILLIAFVTIALPSAYQQLQSAFRAVHPDLEDASRILGATRLGTLARITAPLLRASVIATWCFIFVGVMRELSAAIMLFTSETKVISVLIFDLNESGDLGAIAVLGIIMLAITFAVVILANRVPGFGSARFRP